MTKISINRQNKGNFSISVIELTGGGSKVRRVFSDVPWRMVDSIVDSLDNLLPDRNVGKAYFNQAEKYGSSSMETDESWLNIVRVLSQILESKEKTMKVITLQEEIKLPQKDGTVIVLEKGEKIQLQENILPANVEQDLEKWLDRFNNPFDAGLNFGSAILKFVEESNDEFIEGFFKAIKRVF